MDTNHPITILAIESSCDDTSAAVIRDGLLLSNVTAGQKVHEEFGGVVPELASRAHQQNVLPVVDTALKRAGVERTELSAIAFTRGPGLLGSLLVGTSFAKGLALSLNIPLVEVNHLQGHIMAHFVEPAPKMVEAGQIKGLTVEDLPLSHPTYPYICLLVSGGNSQIVLVRAYNDMTILGQTIDDAAGECLDKCAKVMGLPYPGGPHIDRLAKEGDPNIFAFARPNISGYDYSFSGLKTSFLYTLRDMMKAYHVDSIEDLYALADEHKLPRETGDTTATDAYYLDRNQLMADLCAGLQQTVIDILLRKLKRATLDHQIRQIAVAGGVSANSALRSAMVDLGRRQHWQVFIPPFSFTTDNAAMIAQAGYYKFLSGDFCPIDLPPFAKTTI